LLEQATHRQELLKTLGEKKQELETLRNNCDYAPYEELTIKRLLEVEEDINLCETFGNSKEKEEIIKELNKNGFRGDIKELCQLQADITKIDKQLDKIREQARTIIEDLMELTKGQFFLRGRQQNLILFGDIINVAQGHAIVNSQLGNNTDLSYNRIEEIPTSTTRDKRSFSVSSTTETQEENKVVKLDEEQTEQQAQIQQAETYGTPSSSKL